MQHSNLEFLASIILYINAGKTIVHNIKNGCNSPYLKSRDMLTKKNINRNGMLQLNILSALIFIQRVLKIIKKKTDKTANSCIRTKY